MKLYYVNHSASAIVHWVPIFVIQVPWGGQSTAYMYTIHSYIIILDVSGWSPWFHTGLLVWLGKQCDHLGVG